MLPSVCPLSYIQTQRSEGEGCRGRGVSPVLGAASGTDRPTAPGTRYPALST